MAAFISFSMRSEGMSHERSQLVLSSGIDAEASHLPHEYV